MIDRRVIIRDAYIAACHDEIDALKPGNVHRFADGHRMSVAQFLTSASVSANPISDPDVTVGQRILEAVRATRVAVGTNTNLGIILLCAPIAVAAASKPENLRSGIAWTLASMTMNDTTAIFEAIAIANPGGLGSGGENDVRYPPRIPMIDAMQQAAARDRIAYQYVSEYADIFELGLPAFQHAIRRGETGMWPTIACYLAFLSAFPDSHISRKLGIELAMAIQREADQIQTNVWRESNVERRMNMLLRFDASLKERDINPGTSADLTVSCLFVHRLTERLA